MSDRVIEDSGLNLEALRAAIREEYEAVALAPEQGFHFHTGRPLARLLDYRDAWLEGIPEAAIESFAGTGNPFSIDGGPRSMSTVALSPSLTTTAASSSPPHQVGALRSKSRFRAFGHSNPSSTCGPPQR